MKRLALLLLPLVLSVGASTAQSQNVAQQDPPKIIRKPGGVLEVCATRKVEPAYPASAKAAQVSGDVTVEVTLDQKGNVESARVISGHPLLKESAVAAARKWKFTPFLQSGIPVKVISTLTFNFDLGVQSEEFKSRLKEVERNPGSAEAHYRLGEAYCREDLYQQAVSELRQVIRINPKFVAAHTLLGNAYRELRSYKQAFDSYAAAIRLDSRNVEALMGAGGVASQLGRNDEAVANFERAVEIDPKDTVKLISLGVSYWKIGRQGDAVASFKKVLTMIPNDAQAHFELGRTDAQMGNTQSAMEHYEVLKKANPDLAEILRKLIEK